MDYNRIYKARYMYKQGVTDDLKEIAEATGLSLEMARKAVNDSMKDYGTIKADYAEDQEAGDFTRKYPEPQPITLKGATWENKKERLFKMLCDGEKTLDSIKSLLIADNVKDTQIEKILNELSERYEKLKAVDLAEIAEKLLQIEQLPPKWTINRVTGELVTVYPAPMVDRTTGELYGIRYTSNPYTEWRNHLPVELRIAVYEAEHPLFIDGHKVNPNPDRWGPREFMLIVGKTRKMGYYTELAEYLEMELSELQPYLAKARAHVKKARKEAEAGPVDFKRIERIVAELKAKHRARGGDLKQRKSRKKTAVAE